MTSKIFKSTFLVGVFSVLACVGIFLGVLNQYFEMRIFTELQVQASYAAQGVEKAGIDYFSGLKSDNRITWVDKDGTVLYDNKTDASQLENHLNREEIKQAMESGSGESAR